MVSIFNSYDELVSHASNNTITISNAKIFINELRSWYHKYAILSENYCEETTFYCDEVEDKEYKKFVDNETKLEQIDILIEKYEQFLNEKNEY